MLEHVVFPALQDELRGLKLHLQRVDLRLGATGADTDDEELQQRLVLKVCLQEVDRCRPHLLVLVGQRYGLVPSEDIARAAAEEAGMTYAGPRSVTAMEIEHALSATPDRSLIRIYFRDLDVSEMPEEVAIRFSDERAARSSLLDSTEREAARQRHALLVEQKVWLQRKASQRCGTYSARWSAAAGRVVGLEGFVNQVVSDLVTDLRASRGESSNEFQRFIEEASQNLIGRGELVDSLVEHFVSREERAPGLILTGERGTGKSAVFARCYQRLTADLRADWWVLAHAVGPSVESRSLWNLLKSWAVELATRLGAPASEATPERLWLLIEKVPPGTRVAMLIDGFDQFESVQPGWARGALTGWLGYRLPGKVRMLVTTTAEVEATALYRRGDFAHVKMGALSRTEAQALAESIFARYHRQPNHDAITKLLDAKTADGKPAHATALWMSLAVEQLNVIDGEEFARSEAPARGALERQRQLQAFSTLEASRLPSSLEALYVNVIVKAGKNLLEDAQGGRELARAFFLTLLLSLGGLRSQDLTQLIPRVAHELGHGRPAPPWNDLVFARLRRRLRGYIVSLPPDERWDFRYEPNRAAILESLQEQPALHFQLHSIIASYLLALPVGDPLRERRAMQHLAAANDHGRAAAFLVAAGPEGVEAATSTLGWAAASEAGVAWVIALLDVPLLDAELAVLCERLRQVDSFLDRTVHIGGTRRALGEAIVVTLRRLLSKGVGPTVALQLSLCRTLDQLGDTETDLGNWSAAAERHAEALVLARHLAAASEPGAAELVALVLTHIGALRLQAADWDGAAHHYREALDLLRPLGEAVSSSVRMTTVRLGEIEMFRRNYLAAEVLYRDALADATRVAGARSTSRAEALERVVDACLPQRKFDQAEQAAAEAMLIRNENVDLFDRGSMRALSVAVEKLGDASMAKGFYERALGAYRDCLALRRPMVDAQRPESRRDVSVVLERLGRAAMMADDPLTAEAAFRESLDIDRELFDLRKPESLRDLSVSLERVAELEMEAQKLEAASELFHEAYRISDMLPDRDHRTMVRKRASLAERAGIADLKRQHVDAALPAFVVALDLLRQLPDPDAAIEASTAFVLERIGAIEASQNRSERALLAMNDALSLRQKLANFDEPSSVLDLALCVFWYSQGLFIGGQRQEFRRAADNALAILTELQKRAGESDEVSRHMKHIRAVIARLSE